MTQPKAYVIAHPASTVIEHCVASLKRNGWDYRVVKAVDGRRVTNVDWNRIGVTMNLTGKMTRRPGAQGCWLSHFALWQQAVDTRTSIVILEHDAVVQAPWPVHCDITTSLVKLYTTAECKQNPIFGLWSKGAHAYSVTPAQAQQLINWARLNGAEAVDKHLGSAVVEWQFHATDLVALNPNRGVSSTSPIRK